MAKKKEISFIESMRKLQNSGLKMSANISNKHISDNLGTIEERVKKIFSFIENDKRYIGNMLFFVMYDIESTKVRTQVAKYLIKKGCFRVQRSIFLADISHDEYNNIKNDLAEVQACYDNNDSILIVPVSVELIKSMKIIGKSIDVDIIMKTKSTVIF
jgi:CRISPR-associated protein Cas2